MHADRDEPHDNRSTAEASGATRRKSLLTRAVLYPNVYVWYIFLASLDIILTYLILHPLFSSPSAFSLAHLDQGDSRPPQIESLSPIDPLPYEERGTEVNALADWVIEQWGVAGMVTFKFVLVILVVCICEIVGRRKHETGRRLAQWAVAISAIPIVVALLQMAVDVYSWVLP